MIVIAWCEEGGYSKLLGQRHGKPVNQMKGYDVERKVYIAEWKMNAWTFFGVV